MVMDNGGELYMAAWRRARENAISVLQIPFV